MAEIDETVNNHMKNKITESYVRNLVSKNLRRLRAVHNISQLNLAINAGLRITLSMTSKTVKRASP